MTDANEAAFAQRLKRMDGKAWEEFARSQWRPLAGFVMSRFGAGIEEAEEVVQMTFVRAARSIGTFDAARGSLFGWLKAIAANEARTMGRRGHGQVVFSSLPSDTAGALGAIASEPLPEDVLAGKDFRCAVQDTLAALPAKQRNALVWKYLDGCTAAVVAERMGITARAAESLLLRSREAFAKAFRARHIEEARPLEARDERSQTD